MNSMNKSIYQKIIVTTTAVLLSILHTTAQSTFFEAGLSMRNGQQSHYYKMVNWEDSAYKEFAYWKESPYGAVMEFMNWRAMFPTNYDTTGTETYPMIVMLHGAGESGRKWTGHYAYEPTDPEYDNNGHNLLWGGVEHRNAVNTGEFNGIVLFPQSSYNASWDDDDKRMLAGIIEHMISEYHVNPYQINMHGLSNGARGSWDFASYRPDLIASILPMSGIGMELDSTTDKLITTPVWLFQGGQDTNPSPGAAENWIETLQEKGGKPRYTFYPDNSHNTWLDAYDEPDFFSWMNERDKRKIYIFGDTTDLYLTQHGTIDLGFSEGFDEYQWTLNGSDIPDANTRFFTVDTTGTYTVKFKQRINGEWAESFPLEIEPYSGPPIVHIPDANFKDILLQDTAINTNKDGQIQVSEAEAVNGQLKLNSSNISDLTGIEAFVNITDLRVHYNNLSALNLSENVDLVELHCQANALDSLDLSQNQSLKKLRCFDNNLSYLNIQNGNNHNFGLFQAANNNLGCIQVDDVGYAETNWSDDVDSTAEFSLQCTEQLIVNIPDSQFKQALLSDPEINENEDDEIQFSEAESYADSLDVSGLGIHNLAGVEAFINIIHLNFTDNSVAFVDLSDNQHIQQVIATSNELDSINLGANSSLTELKLDSNALVKIDLSDIPHLEQLWLQNNNLETLILNDNSNLETVYCNNNSLGSLNIKNGENQKITSFDAENNLLSCIEVSDTTYANNHWASHVDEGVVFKHLCGEPVVDIPDQNFKNALLSNGSINVNSDDEIQVSEAESYSGRINVNSSNIEDLTGIEAFTAVTDLRVHNNSIASLDLSSNTALTQLHCQKNNLTSLDISVNVNINKLRCFNNNLTSLNVQNGNNHDFDLFQAYNNDLTCIEVDDVSYAETHWSDDVDEGVSFSTDCSGSSSSIAEQLDIFPNPFTSSFSVKFSKARSANHPEKIQVINVKSGRTIQPTQVSQVDDELIVDLSGLEDGFYLIKYRELTYRIIKGRQ